MRRYLLPLVILLGACGGSLGGNELSGSVKDAYGGLPFSRVDVLRQEVQGKFTAMHVQYVDDKGNLQVHVVALAPVEEGVDKDLTGTGGSLSRNVSVGSTKYSEFPEMKSGKITFDSLGAVGETASGSFYVLFKANPSAGLTVEGTLDGKFSATVQLQAM